MLLQILWNIARWFVECGRVQFDSVEWSIPEWFVGWCMYDLLLLKHQQQTKKQKIKKTLSFSPQPFSIEQRDAGPREK